MGSIGLGSTTKSPVPHLMLRSNRVSKKLAGPTLFLPECECTRPRVEREVRRASPCDVDEDVHNRPRWPRPMSNRLDLPLSDCYQFS